jgi:type VI secretion system secreted protein Hcp
MPIFLNIEGADRPITGHSRIYEMNQAMKVITPGNVDYAIESPRDIATGHATGKRQHKPIVITIEANPFARHFFQKVQNRVLPTLHLNFLRTNARGVLHPFFTITLTDVLTRQEMKPPLQRSRQPRSKTQELLRIEFSFHSIEISFKSGKKSSTDDWASTS